MGYMLLFHAWDVFGKVGLYLMISQGSFFTSNQGCKYHTCLAGRE